MVKVFKFELPQNVEKLSAGYERKWSKCRKCGKLQYEDYVPRSLSNPVRWSACGHDMSHLEKVEIVPNPELYTNTAQYFGESSMWTHQPLIGDPDGEPYVVQVSGKSWIPINALIFAASEDDAKARITNHVKAVRDAYREKLRARLEKDAKMYGTSHDSEVAEYDDSKANSIMNLIESGHIQVEKFDKRFVAKAPWASNDTLV